MKLIFKFILVFIIFSVSVSAYLLIKNKEEKTTKQPIELQPFCGTESDTSNNPDAQKGKQIFNANCAACHKLDAVATGPALRNVASKYHEYNMQLYKYLRGKRDGLLLRHPNKSSMGLCPVFPNLTKEDVASLEAYTH
jgi:cytochrome c551/c552